MLSKPVCTQKDRCFTGRFGKKRAAAVLCVGLLYGYLIKGDLLQVPVVNVEEQDHTPVLVSAGQNHGVSCFDGTAHRLRGQVLKQLGILLPEAHVTWRTATLTEHQ